MITHDVTFVRADSIDDLCAAWQHATKDGRSFAWFGGGTELVTLERDGKKHSDTFIDYKRVPEANRLGAESGQVVLGAAVRLSTLADSWPGGLLARAVGGVADRTVRNSITLGGNICGMLAYREAALPFLLLDGEVEVLKCSTGERAWRPLALAFNKRLILAQDEVALAFAVSEQFASLLQVVAPVEGAPQFTDPGYGAVTAHAVAPSGSWYYRRRTRDPRLDYPLVTCLMARVDGNVRVAISGAWGYPVRATACEAHLGDLFQEGSDRAVDEALRTLCEAAVDTEEIPFKDDMRGSGEYRRELTIQALMDGIGTLYSAENTL